MRNIIKILHITGHLGGGVGTVVLNFLSQKSNDTSQQHEIISLDTINTELQDKFELTYNFIEDALDRNEKVLIHCMYGRSRSATIMIAYLIRKFGYNVQDSLNYVKMCRQDIEPNEYFVKQLENYYNKLYKNYLIN